MIRSRKITAARFLHALVRSCFENAVSFRLIALNFTILTSIRISKQAIAQRMTLQCLEFVRHVLSALISRLSAPDKGQLQGLFSSFSRVLLQDSTQIKLPGHLATLFPGPTNQSRKKTAAIKIHVIHDLTGQRFVDLRLSSFTRTDQSASNDVLAVAKPGDLVVRDLGYFSTPVFRKMIERGVHFLSRLRNNVTILDPGTLEPIDLKKKLRFCGALDQNVLLGAKERLPVRLTALPVPPPVANQRRRKAKTNRDKRLNPSKDRLQLLGWDIYVTSVQDSIWSLTDVQQVYRLRWRIEIIFKSWKTHFNLPRTATGSAIQVEVLILAKLLAICLFYNMMGWLDLMYFKPLSILKCAQFFTMLLKMSMNGPGFKTLSLEPIAIHLELETRKRPQYSPVHRLLT